MLLCSGMDTVLAFLAKTVSMVKGSAVATKAEPASQPVPSPLLSKVVRHLSKNPIGGKTPIQTKTLLVVRHQFKLKSRRGCLKNPLNVPIAKPLIYNYAHAGGRFGRGATAPPMECATLRAGGVSPATRAPCFVVFLFSCFCFLVLLFLFFYGSLGSRGQ
jgi:hypothetical protein